MDKTSFLKKHLHSKNLNSILDINSKDAKWFDAKEINDLHNYIPKEPLSLNFVNNFKYDGTLEIKYITSNTNSISFNNSNDCSVLTAEKENSDIIPSVYEGGLKIWECTYDLVNYLHKEQCQLKGKHVLDLGCGIGVLGIFALINGSYVCFQDYNEEIIKYITIKNIYLNVADQIENRCKFYSGDWQSFLNITETQYDYIFTCETIYNPNNYIKLHNVFKAKLKSDGIIYLAAKTHYFGVGGGVRQFEEYLIKQNVFKFSTSWSCKEGLKREILIITFK